MKRIAQVVAVIAGIAAVVWAMRDRFISVATSREPLPPSFRATPHGTPVDAIDGIGPVFADRLAGAGLGSVAALAKATPDQVAEAASVSTARARTWIELARQA